jgi:hypothetical protein
VLMDTETVHKRGRPRGVRFDAALHIRIPRDMKQTLLDASRASHCTVGDLVRQGINARLNPELREWIRTAKNKTAAPLRRIAAIKKIRTMRKAVLACTEEYGLKLARARANADLGCEP